MTASDKIALAALLISLAALVQSLYFWKRTFRPIVTAMVKTAGGGNAATVFDLVLLNSGSIPAKSVTLHLNHERDLEAAKGRGSSNEQSYFLICFAPETVIPVIHNGAEVSCSFGYVSGEDQGFWRYRAKIPITIRYLGWFGKVYSERQVLEIVDSRSFTGSAWSKPGAT